MNKIYRNNYNELFQEMCDNFRGTIEKHRLNIDISLEIHGDYIYVAKIVQRKLDMGSLDRRLHHERYISWKEALKGIEIFLQEM